MLRLAAIGLALGLAGPAWAACGPTYGADGIAVAADGAVWLTHFEDARLARLDPAGGTFREVLTSKAASPVVTTQAGRTANGQFDYSPDRGLSGIALDETRGALWSVQFNTGRVVRFAMADESFRFVELDGLILGARGPLALAADGSLWIITAQPGRGRLEAGILYRLAPDGTIAEARPLPIAAFSSVALALSPEGRPWVALTPDGGHSAEFLVAESTGFRRVAPGGLGRGIAGMAFDQRGRTWFTSPSRNAVGVLAEGRVDWHALLTPDAMPIQVVPDRDGAMWVTEWEGRKLARIDTIGIIREYPLPPEEDGPITLAPGRNGEIWLSALFSYDLLRLDPTDGSYRRLAVPTPSNWFTEAASPFSTCNIGKMAETPDTYPVTAERHPRHYPSTEAARFETSCNTACHSWYRVERVAGRRTEWTATVDRMIELNGAPITPDGREAVIRYLNATYTAKP
jgi:streptogramin lyase